MSTPFTLTLLQLDLVWGDVAANIQRAGEAILQAPSSDLYLLPEMWGTGFMTHPTPALLHQSVQALSAMQQWAMQQHAAVAGSLPVVAEDGSLRNRFYFVTPSETTFYDKHHLFTYAGEHHVYTAGEERVIVPWRGIRFCLQVCYDLRFPIFSRNAAEGEDAYDALLYVASWPSTRLEAWHTLLKARAIENQCYVCGVNRVGDDPHAHYNGGSALVDAYGRATSCREDVPDSLTVTLDKERLDAFRTKFPVLHDRD